ncbi:glycosyltransferase family 2 protein [Persephonella sp.]
MESKVSVVIPVYNGERFILEAVESALEQDYDNLEIVIVDDASTDNTYAILLENFGDLIGKKIIYHRNEKNMERAFSRNKGVQLAGGDYIFFLDYDDRWKRDYIKSSVGYLQEHDIVYSFPRTFIDEDGNTVRVSRKEIPSLEGIIFSGLIGYPSGTGVRKDRFHGYRDRYLIREDWEFFIRAYLDGQKIKLLDNNMVLMREHRGRTSRNLQFYRATLTVFRDYYNLIPDEYRPDFMFHTGEVALRFGDIILGWKLVLKAISRKPSILKDRRKLLSVLKRGIRFDRALRFSGGNN